MEKVLELYKYVDGVNDTAFPNDDEQVILSSFRYDVKRMGGAPIINCTAYHHMCLDKLWEDTVYATFNGEKFFIKQVPTSSYDNSDSRYKHELELVSERSLLDNVYFYDVVDSGSIDDKPVSNSSKFAFFGTINEFAERLNQSLQYSSVDYSVVVDDGISSEGKMISFQDQFFSNVLQEIYNTYNIPYYFVGKVIHIGYTNNAIAHTFKYGVDESLLSIQKQNANYKIVNRVTGVGSADNIPYYYPNDYESKEEVEANGGTWINPQPNLMPSIYRDTFGSERFYNALNNTYLIPNSNEYYEFDNPYVVGKPKEHIVNFEDIKPTIKGITNSNGLRIDMFQEFAYDLNDNDETDEEGNYLHPYFFAKLRRFDGEHGFNLFDHAIDEQEMTISMTSGSCGACEFVIGVDESTQKNPVQVDARGNLKRDNNGNVVVSGTPQDVQNDTRNNEVWIALKKDINTFGVIMPNATNNYKPSIDDTFVILHIDLPKSYILAAEDKLKEQLVEYMSLNNSEKFNFSISFSRIFFAEHPEILSQLNENARIQIEYDNTRYELYISSYSYSMSSDKTLPEIRVELTDTLTISQNALQTAISEVKNDIFSNIGNSQDFLKQGLRYFLRKDKDDRTPFKLNVGDKFIAEKGFQIGESFVSGILNGSGGLFDEFANGELESLIIRRFLEVPELRFNRVEIKLGDRWNAPGAGIFESVEPDFDDEGNILMTGTGYLKLEEGEYGAIAVGDICMGIFHSMTASENATEDSDDSRGNFLFAGFYTCYFTITEITGKDNKQFRYQMRPVSDRWKLTYHPSEAMTFVCYGSFTRTDRQTSVYTTRTYTRLLKNQNTWEISASNIAMQYGNMENMSIHGLDMTGYSMYLNNIYMTGVLKQVKPDGTPMIVANDRGNWVNNTDYSYYDRVSHDGSLWLCVNENGTNSEPSKGNSDWLLQVASGASLSAEGRFNSSNAPYQPNSVVEFADKVWINTEVTSNAPYGCWTDNSGNRLLFNDGGFILADETQDGAWRILIDISGFTDGQDGAGLIVQYSADKVNWHDTFVQNSDIYMRQKVGETGVWSDAMRIIGEDGQAKDGIYTDFQFSVNSSLTTAPTTGWQDAPPPVGLGQYLWMRVRVVNPNEGTATSWEVTRVGGEKGNKGDSVTLAGNWNTGMSVKYLAVVRMGGTSWSAKKDTTNPPMWCWTDNSGNRLLFNDGGYVLTGSINTEEYQEVASDGSNGKDGANGKDGVNGKDGKDGLQGIQGCVIRDSEWASGVEYRNDEGKPNGYIDVVLVRDDSTTTGWVAYKCKVTHTSSSSITPTNTTYWEEFAANVSAIFTSLIIAKNAKITFLQGNQLLMQKSDGTITAGLSGSQDGNKIRIWAGSSNPDSAPFRVNESGEAWLTNAHVSGEINASSGIIGGFKITESYLQVGSNVISEPDKNAGMFMLLNSSGVTVNMLGRITANTNIGIKDTFIVDTNYFVSMSMSHLSSLDASAKFCGINLNLQPNDIGLYINGGSTHILSGGITKIHGLVLNKRTVSSSVTLTENDDVVTFNASSDITVTLPSSVPVGKVYYLKNISGKAVTLSGYIRQSNESGYSNTTRSLNNVSWMAVKTDVAWTLFYCG